MTKKANHGDLGKQDSKSQRGQNPFLGTTQQLNNSTTQQIQPPYHSIIPSLLHSIIDTLSGKALLAFAPNSLIFSARRTKLPEPVVSFFMESE